MWFLHLETFISSDKVTQRWTEFGESGPLGRIGFSGSHEWRCSVSITTESPLFLRPVLSVFFPFLFPFILLLCSYFQMLPVPFCDWNQSAQVIRSVAITKYIRGKCSVACGAHAEAGATNQTGSCDPMKCHTLKGFACMRKWPPPFQWYPLPSLLVVVVILASHLEMNRVQTGLYPTKPSVARRTVQASSLLCWYH